TQPSGGGTTVTISGSFTEANPNTNSFYLALNGGAYGGATAGDTNTASPTVLATAAGATLDGNDYVSKVKISHTDDYGNVSTNETTSPDGAKKYVKPYTPAAPTVNAPTSSTVNVTVNANAGEAAGLSYAINETTTGNYVQADGTLGVGAVWATTDTWGAKTVTGLTSPVANYSFRTMSRNSSDGGNQATSQSELSVAASVSNTAPSLALGAVSQTTDGTKYVTINYTLTDAQSDTCSLASYQYSTNEATWATMTEKAGVGSDGTSSLTASSGGTAHDFAWDVGTDLASTEDSSVYVRLKANDGTVNSSVVTSDAFAVDTWVPRTNAAADVSTQPSGGGTTVTISGSFTEANPNTNSFYLALNGGAYGGATAGDTNTASPAALATAAGATLDGNDYVPKVKISHTDDYGNVSTNET
ncbi:MAG: hypothetical protein Q8O57_02395, partial [Kiritimatiellota bacterium]|nr:hypothetical protein [Kiritimatiellota bacterium]